MQMTIELSKEMEKELLGKAKDEVRKEVISEEIRKHLQDNDSAPIVDVMSELGIYERYQNIESTKVKDLSRSEKLVCALYWLMYDVLK